MSIKDATFVKFLIELPEEQKRWATLILCAIIVLYQSYRYEQKEIKIKQEFLIIIQDLKIERGIIRKELNECKDQRFEDANYFRDKFLELKSKIK